ncbi:E-selectin-like isoform X2 [Lissotriton helveticus]
MIGLWILSVINYGLLMLPGVESWTYHYSNNTMNYTQARRWCRAHYTDMVAIQNQAENQHLNELLPFAATYYWIGIRKIQGQWTWVGTNKILTEEATNWATNEPNNKRNNEDCVEIYIKRRQDQGSWNDESCRKKKVALCYTAACHPASCNGNGECVETINNYTCKCNEGFYGPECQHVVACEPLDAPGNGVLNCTHPVLEFSYMTSCQVSCEEGYALDGTDTARCASSGHWTAALSECQAVACDALVNPANGVMSCSHPLGDFKYNSTCNIACEEGFVMEGSDKLVCEASGEWDTDHPQCKAVKCGEMKEVEHGTVSCTSPHGDFSYKSTCDFACADGFALMGSHSSLQCTAQGHWTGDAPKCQAVRCGEVAGPEHGSVACTGPHGDFSYSSVCDFTCAEGYTLSGSSSLQCTAQGEWTGEPPKCEALTCAALKRPEHGEMTCTSAGGEFAFDSSCSFHCEEGFELIGEPTLRCSSSGLWTEQAPTCQAAQCEILAAPHDGVMNCSRPFGDFQYKTVCSYECTNGKTLQGFSTLECSASGNWTASSPQCREPEDPDVYVAVGIAATGASLLSMASLVMFLIKRLRKTAKKFRPSSSCQSLESSGVYQSTVEQV